MKKIITFITLSILLTSCDFEKLTTIQDDFAITVTAEPVISKVSLKIFDANGGKEIPSKVTLSFEGENADQIHAINGSKTFNVDQGFITVGVNTNYTVSKTSPLVVSANISANGYISKVREITFDGSDIREEQVSLLEKTNLPDAIILETVNENLSENKTTNEINVSITSKTNSEEITEFTIPTNTSFYDEDDNIIAGSAVVAEFQTFDAEAPDENDVPSIEENPETFNGGNDEFPGGLNLDGDFSGKTNRTRTKTILNSLNQKLDNSYLIPVTNLWCFYLYVNGKKVYRFSNPTLVRNYIYNNAFNPNTNQPAKVGDAVSVYYFNRTTWQKEKLTSALIQSDGRGFYVEFTAPRSGVYPIGFEVDFNHSCTSINSVKFVNNGRKSFYWYQVAHKSNPTRAIKYGYMYFDGTKEVNDSNLNYWKNRGFSFLGDDMVLKIYNYSYDNRRYNVVYDQEISICELDGQTIDISNTDCFVERDMDLTLECPDATYILNNVYVYYKKEGGYWSYFDQVKNSKLRGKSPCLESGVKYEFGFWYNGWKVTPPLTEAKILDLFINFDVPTVCREVRNLQ
jgi:hypothetical protein